MLVHLFWMLFFLNIHYVIKKLSTNLSVLPNKLDRSFYLHPAFSFFSFFLSLLIILKKEAEDGAIKVVKGRGKAKSSSKYAEEAV